jgi:MoaA/NifB/PqqE/SkfB family radical SAM enzyme
MFGIPIEIWEQAVSNKSENAFENFFYSLNERKEKKIITNSKPYILYIDPVTFCNLECPFCETGKRKNNRESSKMGFSKFTQIIDKMGPYIFDLFFYNWGEPLLHPDISKMIKYAKKYSLFTHVSSNLSIPLKDNQLEDLITSGLDLLICSIDGATQESYEKYRIGGNFDLTISNLRKLCELKKELNLEKPYIIWRFFVFKHNEHEIEKAKNLAQQIGVTIQFAKPHIDQFVDPENWISTIPEYSTNIISRTSQNSNTKDKIINQNEIPHFEKINNEKSCNWLYSSMVINANSSVSPCCATILEKNDFGFFEADFDGLWNNKNYQIARESFFSNVQNKNIICTRCPVPDVQIMGRPWEQAIINLAKKKFPKLVDSYLN